MKQMMLPILIKDWSCGPFDLDYPGPDANDTECNHKPDLIEGIGSEPNFGFTDISESDMLGLTSFRYDLDRSIYIARNDVKDSTGANQRLELVGHDVNQNGTFEWRKDRVLAGFLTDQGRRPGLWAGLSFIFDFQNVVSDDDLPKPGDVYHLTFFRGFTPTDSVTFKVRVEKETNLEEIKNKMQDIKVVPNPYVVSNVLEPAIGNWERNQPRRLMFTHLPAQCTIRIFTISGLLVDVIDVNNSTANRESDRDTDSSANGTAFWDL